MNIYALDEDPKTAAQYHCDMHCIAMIKDYCIILSTAHSKSGTWKFGMLEPKYENHPCNVWARLSKQNYEWLAELTVALCNEFSKRYSLRHSLTDVAMELAMNVPSKLRDTGITKWSLSMPSEYAYTDAVYSYREYYKAEKSTIAQWKHSERPEWYPEELLQDVVVDSEAELKRYLLGLLNIKKK